MNGKRAHQRHSRRRTKTRTSANFHPALGQKVDLVIDAIGHGGDGIGRFENAPVFIPFALPGDRLTVTLTGRRGEGFVADIMAEEARAPRAQPSCPHFQRCGGCQLQHLQATTYQRWKLEQVEKALLSRGLADIKIRPLITGAPALRRRLRLAFDGQNGSAKSNHSAIKLGFRARHSRTIMPIDKCVIAKPALIDLLPALNRLLGALDMAGEGGELLLTSTMSGIDLLLQAPNPPGLADREALGGFAETHDLARLAWRPSPFAPTEPIAARRPAQVKMGGIGVDLPIGAFLQATEPAEDAIRQAINEALGEAGRLIDLFTGCGAFSLPFAASGREVVAFERDQAMVEALRMAARRAGIESKLRAEARDLDRDPLQEQELGNADALILDPPRAGAERQVEALAMSPSPKKIAMASCNPATFARDARHLIDAGYRLSWVQPIDAFLWSTEIELVGAFEHVLPS